MGHAGKIEKIRAATAELYKGSEHAEPGLILDLCDAIIELSGRVDVLEEANPSPLGHVGSPGPLAGKKGRM